MRLRPAALGWICIGFLAVGVELYAVLSGDWTLSRQMWEWLTALPVWANVVLFVAWIALGVHLWWRSLFARRNRE